jgi:hypothetical protein
MPGYLAQVRHAVREKRLLLSQLRYANESVPDRIVRALIGRENRPPIVGVKIALN